MEACEVCKASLEADDFRAEPELTWSPFFAVNYVVMNRGEQGGKLHQYTSPGTLHDIRQEVDLQENDRKGYSYTRRCALTKCCCDQLQLEQLHACAWARRGPP
jgi:hypothetical protein